MSVGQPSLSRAHRTVRLVPGVTDFGGSATDFEGVEVDFKSLLGILQNPPEGVLPDSIYEDLQGAYDAKPDFGPELEEMTKARDALQTQFDDLSEKFTGAQDKIQNLVNQNYDLLQSLGSGGSAPGDAAGAEEESAPAPENPVDAIKNLFTSDDTEGDE